MGDGFRVGMLGGGPGNGEYPTPKVRSCEYDETTAEYPGIVGI